jgi:hypothetical protein
MKRIFVSLVLFPALTACNEKPAAPVFHVTAAESSCGGGLIVGTASIKGGYRTYTLMPDRTQLNETLGPYGQFAVACYGPIGPDDVGKEYAATVRDGVVSISVPGKSVFRYDIQSVREGR